MHQTILYVEDDANDQFFVERIMKKLALSLELKFVSTGVEAIQYLTGEGEFSDRRRFPLPTLILMDIKMPGKSGLEVLEWLKDHAALKKIPVVMISSSSLQEDIDRAYELGANAYVVKPPTLDQLQKLFKATGEFFGEHVSHPSVSVVPA